MEQSFQKTKIFKVQKSLFHACSYSQTATTLKPVTNEVTNNDIVITKQCLAENIWVEVFVWILPFYHGNGTPKSNMFVWFTLTIFYEKSKVQNAKFPFYVDDTVDYFSGK